jgi:hypothetical protein
MRELWKVRVDFRGSDGKPRSVELEVESHPDLMYSGVPTGMIVLKSALAKRYPKEKELTITRHKVIK